MRAVEEMELKYVFSGWDLGSTSEVEPESLNIGLIQPVLNIIDQ